METKIITTDANGISEDGLPTYSQNNELIKGMRCEVTGPHTRVREWFIDHWGGWVTVTDENVINFYTTSRFKGKCEVERIYRQVAIKEEKASDGKWWVEQAKECDKVIDVVSKRLTELQSSAQPVKEGATDEQFEADVKYSFKCWNTGLGLIVPGLVKSLADKGITLAKHQLLTDVGKDAIYPDIEARATKFTELNPNINPWMAYCHGSIDERNKAVGKDVKSAEELMHEMLIMGDTVGYQKSDVIKFAEVHAAQFAQRDEEKVQEVIKIIQDSLTFNNKLKTSICTRAISHQLNNILTQINNLNKA